MIQTKVTAINLDDVVDAQSAISNAFMRIAQAECVIDCMLTMGNMFAAEDFSVQLAELADILQSAQTELMRSETWISCDHDYHDEHDEHDDLSSMTQNEFQHGCSHNFTSDPSNKMSDFDDFMDFDKYEAIKKIVKRELAKQKRKQKSN